MKPFIKIVILCFLIPQLSIAQLKHQINGVKVIQSGDTLTNAWVGGFNNPVFSPIDFNEDGLMDLFVYDKAGFKSLSFVNTGSVGHASYTYAPQYDLMFPQDMKDWAVVRDYNHDGVGDIFSLGVGGIMVYKGHRNGNDLSYTLVTAKLLFPFGHIFTNIYTFSDNLPVIMDIDGDGDLDILAPNVQASGLYYYQNLSADSSYGLDSLSFILADQCWGRFLENGSNCNVTLNQSCKKELLIDSTNGSSARHQGGSCFGTHYRRNSNVTSVFIGDIYCNTMKLLINAGDTSFASIQSVDTLFPSYDVPINMSLFPAVYGIDMNNDGFEDILAAPFATNNNVTSQSEDRNVVQYYRNIAGTDTVNKYQYQSANLFNQSIVDVGTESHPVFFDYNNDGLMDIVIGRFGQFVSPGNPSLSTPGLSKSSLVLYKNIGKDTMPIFELTDTDWNHLSVFDVNGQYNGMYPAFGDLDGDGLPDMVLGNYVGNVSFFHNAGTSSLASYPSMTHSNWFGIDVGNDAAPFIYDVNGDGLKDLVIGSSGRTPSGTRSHIFYYWNFGTPTNPMFSTDSVNTFFGNMDVSELHDGQFSGFANPSIATENGAMVVYSGSARGLTYKYAVNTDSLRRGSFALIDSNVIGIKPGIRSSVSVADINHDGKNDYLTGNIRGGIMLFSDTAWGANVVYSGISSVSPDNDQLVVYPNPAKDNLVCRIGKGSHQLVSAQLYDMLGALASTNITQIDENGIVLAVSNLSGGIYIVQANDKNGKMYQRKIAIIK